MPPKKKNSAVIAICIQEPYEDGSSMDFGAIKGDDLRFLHQAFITDTISNSLGLEQADVRLYYIDDSDRKKLVKIVTDYLKNKLTGKNAQAFAEKFQTYELDREHWGIRIQKVFQDCFETGYQDVIVIGSRTPTVTTSMLKLMLKMLHKSDAVFGPTPEGRYYLIGMSGDSKINLADFDWKTPTIYSEVAQAFSEHKLAWTELEIWYAVETPDDLEILARDINQYRFEGDDNTGRETEVALERILARLEP